jgi:NAD(P)-dependent dehydrogenase (short-subunit alcohol dehydrogenase family)
LTGVVVVTGASAGIGRATAYEFAREGATVALLARNVERLELAKHEIEADGGRAIIIPLDVSNADQVEAATERIEREIGPIDVWVNNAMVTVFSRLIDVTPEEHRRVMEVTYLGAVHGTLAALKRMRERNRGVIVQVGSALAYRAIPLQGPYCAAKFAMRGFTDSLRTELIHEGSRVHITMVQLCAFNTPQFDWARSHMPRRAQPVPPIYQPEIAAKAIVWAARHPRRERWIGFPTVRTILGQAFVPGLLDRLAARMAYDSQMTSEKKPPNTPDNLFETAPGSHAAHGRFDEKAHTESWHLWASMHRRNIAIGAIVLVGLVLVLLG